MPARPVATALALLTAAAIVARPAHSTPRRPARQTPAPRVIAQKGIALGLFAEDPGFDYRPLLREIAATGANAVSIVVPYYQHDVRSIAIAPHPRLSPREAVVRRTIDQARELGLKVLLFPILRLGYKVTDQEWRGALRPRDPSAWWASYRRFILGFADLARTHNAHGLCVGSELGALDTDPAPWVPLIAEVRRRFGGQLVYSANWDHFRQVGIWHLVDAAGLSAYFQLSAADRQDTPSLERLLHGWREHRALIARWWARMRKPLMITELGYHSQRGTSARPWDEAAKRPVDAAEQARALRAFFRVWRNAPYLEGVYVWNWFGWGGDGSREYTPRGKPAVDALCEAYGAAEGRCPRHASGNPWFDWKR